MGDAQYFFYIDWNGDEDFTDADENVSGDVAARESVAFSHGRDEARALTAISAGETAFDLYNREGKYSPDNTNSPLYGNLVPGRKVLVQARHLGNTYTMFRGFIDQFEIKPSPHDPTVNLSILDLLHKFSVADMNTDMYPSLMTGEAVHVLLDAIGWPEGDDYRDIDSGATTLRWWAAAGNDALTTLTAILEAEGPPAVAYAEGDKFIYRDRHHRLLRPESNSVVATFRSSGTEPTFCEPMTYNIGWKDLVNRIQITVAETIPDLLSDIFTSQDTIAMTSGESRTFEISGEGGEGAAGNPGGGSTLGGSSGGTSEGFVDALVPVEGIDYTLVSGAFDFTLSRTNGLTATLEVNCTSTGSIVGLRVRGRSIIVRNESLVIHNDTGSQTEHGIKSLQDNESLEMGNRHDALAIAKIITAQRSQRRPVVSITVNNGNDARLTQILERQISDRIHIIEPEQTFIHHDYFIDRIEHNVDAAGKDHRATFICERALEEADDPDPPVWFTFDDANAGFDEGAFIFQGMSFTETIMVLDDPTTGALGTGGLGW